VIALAVRQQEHSGGKKQVLGHESGSETHLENEGTLHDEDIFMRCLHQGLMIRQLISSCSFSE